MGFLKTAPPKSRPKPRVTPAKVVKPAPVVIEEEPLVEITKEVKPMRIPPYPEFWGDVRIMVDGIKSAWGKRGKSGGTMNAVRRLEAQLEKEKKD